MSSENTLLTAEDVARIIKVSIRTVRRWVATGQIEIVEIGKLVAIALQGGAELI